MGYEQEDTRNELVLVGVDSVIVAEARPDRISIYLRNTSANAVDIITVVFGNQTAVLLAGQVQNPGDTSVDSNNADYKCYQGVITAICATADGQLSIYER